MIYIISDTHFGHKSMIKQGWRAEGTEELMIKNWNKVVGKDDIVFHLGDFAMGRIDELSSLSESIKKYRELLSGRIILLRGNHDGHANEWYMSNGFEVCANEMVYWHKGKKLKLRHIPIVTRIRKWDLHIHGHLHGNTHRLEGGLERYRELTDCVDVSADCLDFTPVSLDSLIRDNT